MAKLFPSSPLLIPVHLDALCIGRDDAAHRHTLLSGPTTNFGLFDQVGQNLPNQDKTPYLGDHVKTALFSGQSKIQPGVNLHWELPRTFATGEVRYELTEEALLELNHRGIATGLTDKLKTLYGKQYTDIDDFQQALAPIVHQYLQAEVHIAAPSASTVSWYLLHIVKASGQLYFPAVPNRWLIVRVPASGGAPKAWVIESDALSTAEESSPTCVPSMSPKEDIDAGKKIIRYMGRVRSLTEAWPETGEIERMEELTGIGHGMISFSGYAPNCQRVFAFHDPMKDSPQSGTETFSYMVTGWFSDPKNDPLANLSAQELVGYIREKKWNVPGLFPSKKENSTEPQADLSVLQGVDGGVCYGMLKEVQWNPDHQYLTEGDASQMDVVVANTASEGLAAYLAQQAASDDPEDGLALEEQLEALQLGLLSKIQKDPEPEVSLENALHTSAFAAADGSFLWSVVKKAETPDPSKASAGQFDESIRSKDKSIPVLPHKLAHLLNVLNLQQQQYDKSLRETRAQRQQILADWTQYIKWSYGQNIDESRALEVKDTIYDANNLKDDQTEIGYVKSKLEPSLQQCILAKDPDDEKAGIVALIQKVDALLKAEGLDTHYELQLAPAPRFYQPNEPVILLVDKSNRISSRFDRDNTALLCRRPAQLLSTPPASSSGSPAQLDAGVDVSGEITDPVIRLVNQLLKEECYLPPNKEGAEEGNSRGLNLWGRPDPNPSDGVERRNPWHLIRLEWEVTFYPLKRDRSKGYPEDFMTQNAVLGSDHIDLKIQSGLSQNDGNICRGELVLSRQALSTLKDQADRYFGGNDFPALKALADQAGRYPVLMQALDGFNDALLTLAKGAQLPIYDPYSEDPSMAQAVKETVGKNKTVCPVESGKFDPIRAGSMKVNHLRLVDLFGQYEEVGEKEQDARDVVALPVIRPLQWKPERRIEGAYDRKLDDEHYLVLSPRIAQPSRLQFRWLSADDKQVEMNDHPATSPVFGWVLSNHLDNSLMIYDGAGTHLGNIQHFSNTAAHPLWQEAPGAASPVQPEKIEHPQLRAFVQGWLQDTAENFGKFRSTMERVLQTIEPSTYRESSPLAVLMGRPLALVQARLNLELESPPRVNLSSASYTNFYLESDSNDPPPLPALDSQGFERVLFPVRLGDLGQVNDGLVGYFKVEKGTVNFNYDHFQAEDQADNLLLRLEDKKENEQQLVMLVDPRAPVHATSGILPVKAIDIPRDQYSAALNRIEFTLLVNPILNPDGTTQMPLPAESQQEWSWLSLAGQSWNPPLRNPKKPGDRADLSYTGQQIKEGWLRMRPLDPAKNNANH